MHPGKLEGHTAAARVYHALRSDPGRWWGGSELAEAAGTTCVSTRISEVRHQLPAGERLEHRTEVFQFQRKQFYRIVVEGLARCGSTGGCNSRPAVEADAPAGVSVEVPTRSSEGPGLRAPGRQPSSVIDPAGGTARLILGGGSTTEAAASQPTPTATADGRRVQDRQARPRVVIRGTDAP